MRLLLASPLTNRTFSSVPPHPEPRYPQRDRSACAYYRTCLKPQTALTVDETEPNHLLLDTLRPKKDPFVILHKIEPPVGAQGPEVRPKRIFLRPNAASGRVAHRYSDMGAVVIVEQYGEPGTCLMSGYRSSKCSTSARIPRRFVQFTSFSRVPLHIAYTTRTKNYRAIVRKL